MHRPIPLVSQMHFRFRCYRTPHHKLLTKLLSEMAKVLGYDLQQLDVLEGGYYPQGFADIDLEQQELRRGFIQVLSGNRPLRVSPAAPAPPAPFPPPPAPPGVNS